MALPPASSLVVEPIGLDANTIARPLDLPAIFGNDHPVELEIGMGKGTFLTDQSRRHPEVNFISIEYANWYWRYASDRLRRNNCLNVRTFRTEAGHFVKQLLPAESLSAIHIYFPDPWPKKRHHKNRLINERFPALARAALAPAGKIYLRTDDAPYFAQMTEVFAADKRFEKIETPPALAAVFTDFEKGFHARGIHTLRAAYQLIA